MATSKLNRTETAGNRQVWTFSAWVKRSSISSVDGQYLFSSSDGSNNYNYLQINPSDQLRYLDYTSGNNSNKITNQLFRDCSGYYHIVCAVDTTDGTAEDRVKLYVNGERITSFATNANHSANDNTEMNVNTYTMSIGSDQQSGGGQYWNGLMSNIAFVDGTALAPTEFGSVDATSGIWKFKPPSGLTWGTNGFWLKGENSGALGTDSSGETNTFTVSGTPTQSIDTPSNVFATMNPLDNYYASSDFSEGNNTVDMNDSGNETYNTSTLGAKAGKYYAEVKLIDSSAKPMTGVVANNPVAVGTVLGNTGHGYAYMGENGQIKTNSSNSAYGNTYTTNDIISIALDLDNNKLYFAKNGTWQDSGDPTSGSTGTGAVSITAPSSTTTGAYFFAAGKRHSDNNKVSWNFGNGYFGTTVVSSAGTSSSGDDSVWEYDCPTGYYGLNTKNLNTYG